MFLSKALTTASTLLVSLAFATPATKVDKRYVEERDGVTHHVFEHAATGARLLYTKNSGICETTQGVNQYSGYLSVGHDMNMWFWFFEARHNPTTAPLASWFNGGPGCSSMAGVFQEHGPCHFVGGSRSPSLNPYSWNEYANMVYIDQPIGTGFSYGNERVGTTAESAPYVWIFLQAFYAQFTEYENRDFGIFTQSYGGHFGPEFAEYLYQRNAAIDKGSIQGHKINLVALGINNGWTDSAQSYKAQVDYSFNNPYKQLIDQQQYYSYLKGFNEVCLPALELCQNVRSASACRGASETCFHEIEHPISGTGLFDIYDIRAPYNNPNPPGTYVGYLRSSAVRKAIGARSEYIDCSHSVFQKFQRSGDDARNFLPELSETVQSGVQVLLWAGDADWMCNWLGVQAAAAAVTYSGSSAFNAAALSPYTLNGVHVGDFKSHGNLAFLRVFNAGHTVSYYQPATALQVFTQTMQKRAISST